MKVHPLPQCPVCGAGDFLGFDLGEGNVLRRCRTCDAVSAPEYADPSEVYTDGYLFGQSQFGLDVRHPHFQRFLLRVAHQRFEMIEQAAGGPGRFLDVGCGSGEVLLAGRERGWEVQGVEPEATGAAMAQERGLDVKVGLLEESGLPERHYDVVAAFHVLEHVPDSRAFLKTMARWARPGGHVVIEVPNFKSVQRRRLGHWWTGLRPLEHIVHFTPETLERAFSGAGLEPVLTRSPAYVGPPQNLDHALNDLVRRGLFARVARQLSPVRDYNGERARVPSRAGWALLHAMEAVYDRAGVGAVVVCVARVP